MDTTPSNYKVLVGENIEKQNYHFEGLEVVEIFTNNRLSLFKLKRGLSFTMAVRFC